MVSRLSTLSTTWPMPSGPVRKPEIERPGRNGSVAVSAPWKISQPVAERVGERDQIRNWALVGQRAAAARNLDPCAFEMRRQCIECSRVGDFPAEERDALAAVGIDDDALLAVVHAEGERVARFVDALQAEEPAAVARPIVQILGADPDITQRLWNRSVRRHGRKTSYLPRCFIRKARRAKRPERC